MKTYENNDGQWHLNAQPLWMRVFRWFVWLGGWEKVVHDTKGYRYQWHAVATIRRKMRVYEGKELVREVLCSVTPLGFFGKKIVFQWFGVHIVTCRGYLCVLWPSHASGKGWQVYASPNATPSSATWWLVGAPADVKTMAQRTAQRKA